MTPQQTAVYTALAALRDAGLVTDRAELNQAYYTLTREFARNPISNPWPTRRTR